MRCVLGYDHFGVSGGVASDVLHRLSDRGAEYDRHVERKVLFCEILLRGGARAGDAAADLDGSVERHSRVDQRLTKPLEVGKIAVNDKRFRRVAHRRALRFRVYHDPLCHFGIGARIDEDVAVSDTRFNHGDGGVLDHA